VIPGFECGVTLGVVVADLARIAPSHKAVLANINVGICVTIAKSKADIHLQNSDLQPNEERQWAMEHNKMDPT
jgi:hypothetical protein